MKIKFIFLCLPILLAACGLSEADVQATISALPSNTVILPSETATPSATSSPTITPTRTPTATKTETPTPVPPLTLTAEVAQITATAKSAFATSTQQARELAANSTATAQSAQKTLVAQYQPIARREIVTYADSYIGELVVIRGRVFNINGTQEVQIWIDDSFDAAYIVMAQPFRDIYDNDFLIIYGEVYGEHCGTNSWGSTVCQPLIIDAFYEKR